MPAPLTRARVLVTALVVLVLVLSACGSGTGAPGGSSDAAKGRSAAGAGTISVVASTNVWGNVAAVVGGTAVRVTSIVSDPQRDPHSYQADAQVALQLSKAQLVIENGGGYDDFVDTMLASLKGTPTVVNAVAVAGVTAPKGGELNEHVWYSFPSAQKVADRIALALGRRDPARAATFAKNAHAFDAQVDQLIRGEARLKARYAGDGAGITEPVPLYLLEAAGLQIKTPEAFSAAVEAGDDVSAAVLKQTLDLYATHSVRVLVYNAQTIGPITEQVKAAAAAAGVPVVPVTETLPQGETYLTWMQGNLDRLGRALGQR